MRSSTCLQHLVQDALQSIIFQGRSYALLVAQLLVHLVILAVAVLLATHNDTVVGGECLLKTHSHPKTDDGCERAMCDSRRDLDSDLDDGIWRRCTEGRGGRDVDVWKIDNGQLSKRDRVFGIRYSGD
jgi:hypothetical protein